jgi:ubiquinone/menaquinone biosynthesis C-methylase UbiE
MSESIVAANPKPVDERLSMDSSAYIEILFHWQRYLAAAEVCRGKRVLDLASGEGYGSNALAREAAYVLGVDVDADAVEAARQKYTADNLCFMQGSADRIPAEDASFDVVVSFETIEHMPEEMQHRFLDEVLRVLRPDGLFLVSSPDRHRTERSGMHNPYHVHELYLEEMHEILRDRFAAVDIYFQETNLGAFLWKWTEKESQEVLRSFRIDHRGKEAVPTDLAVRLHLYLVAVCRPTPGPMPSLSSVCAEISRKGLDTMWNEIGALGWKRNQLELENRQLRQSLEGAMMLRKEYERATVQYERLRNEHEELRSLAARPWWIVVLQKDWRWRALKSVVRMTPGAHALRPLKDRVYNLIVRK